jgi:hypothetical protein
MNIPIPLTVMHITMVTSPIYYRSIPASVQNPVYTHDAIRCDRQVLTACPRNCRIQHGRLCEPLKQAATRPPIANLTDPSSVIMVVINAPPEALPTPQRSGGGGQQLAAIAAHQKHEGRSVRAFAQWLRPSPFITVGNLRRDPSTAGSILSVLCGERERQCLSHGAQRHSAVAVNYYDPTTIAVQLIWKI